MNKNMEQWFKNNQLWKHFGIMHLLMFLDKGLIENCSLSQQTKWLLFIAHGQQLATYYSYMHVDSTSMEYFHSPYNHCELRARIPLCCFLATPKDPSKLVAKRNTQKIRLCNRLRYQSSPCKYVCIASACSL
jgi:hypothetical protein